MTTVASAASTISPHSHPAAGHHAGPSAVEEFDPGSPGRNTDPVPSGNTLRNRGLDRAIPALSEGSGPRSTFRGTSWLVASVSSIGVSRGTAGSSTGVSRGTSGWSRPAPPGDSAALWGRSPPERGRIPAAAAIRGAAPASISSERGAGEPDECTVGAPARAAPLGSPGSVSGRGPGRGRPASARPLIAAYSSV